MPTEKFSLSWFGMIVVLSLLAGAFSTLVNPTTDPRGLVVGSLAKPSDHRYQWSRLDSGLWIKRVWTLDGDLRLTIDPRGESEVYMVLVPCSEQYANRYLVVEWTIGDPYVIIQPCSGRPVSQLEPFEWWLGSWLDWFGDAPTRLQLKPQSDLEADEGRVLTTPFILPVPPPAHATLV